jgi:hypothetical protein
LVAQNDFGYKSLILQGRKIVGAVREGEISSSRSGSTRCIAALPQNQFGIFRLLGAQQLHLIRADFHYKSLLSVIYFW